MTDPVHFLAFGFGTGLAPFADRFPDRFFDVGIAEQHAVTFAAGMASQGMRPFVAIYSTFLQRAYDQIIHDVCLQNLPVRFMIDRGGLVGDDGPTHHGAFDLTFLRTVPNLVVMTPKVENELASMVRTASPPSSPPSPSPTRSSNGCGWDFMSWFVRVLSVKIWQKSPKSKTAASICVG